VSTIPAVKAVTHLDSYRYPRWLNKQKKWKRCIELSKDTPVNEVEIFIAGLFGYKSVDFTNSPKQGFENLIYEYEVNGFAISGGVLFFDKQNKIYPGCCCGLEDWKEVFKCISRKESPWMGHDKYPVIEYVKKKAIMWSDDCLGIYGEKKSKNNLYSIEYQHKDLECMSADIENDLFDFITTPFSNRIIELDVESSDKVVNYLLSVLGIKI